MLFRSEKLKQRFHDLSERSTGILGMTFKAESDDIRESLSFKLRKILELEAREVLCSDEFFAHPEFVDKEEVVRRCDIIIVGAPHRAYKNLDYKDKFVFDLWNLIGKGIVPKVVHETTVGEES